MSPNPEDFGIDRLSADDRLALAEAIWESVARELEQTPLSGGQRRELERRLADSIARPEAVIGGRSLRRGRWRERASDSPRGLGC